MSVYPILSPSLSDYVIDLYLAGTDLTKISYMYYMESQRLGVPCSTNTALRDVNYVVDMFESERSF